MDNDFSPIIDALKSSVNIKLILRYFLLVLSYLVVSLTLILLIFGTAFWMIISPFLSKLALVQDNPMVLMELGAMFFQNLPLIILIVVVALIIMIILIILWESVLEGAELFFAKTFLTTGEISLSNAFKNAMPNVLNIFKVKVLLAVIFFILYLVLITPVILTAIGMMSSMPALVQGLVAEESSALLQIRSLAGLNDTLSSLHSLIVMLLAPILLLIVPLILFEKLGVIPALKRAWALAKTNYLGNLVFVILIGIVEFILVILAMIVASLILIPFIALIFVLGIAAVILIALVALILLALIMGWITAFHFLAIVKFYEFATGNAAGPKPVVVSKPVLSAKPKPAAKTMPKPNPLAKPKSASKGRKPSFF